MNEQRQHLGIARIRISHGQRILIFPLRLVRLFGLREGDEVVLRKRRGRAQYLVDFWRRGRRLGPSGKSKGNFGAAKTRKCREGHCT
jgi:hypothetical protein